MYYENNNKRIHWLTISLNAIPDILIALIIAVVIEGGVLAFLLTFAGLQLVYLLVWMKNAVIKRLLLKAHNQADSGQWKWVYLRERGYPQPDSHDLAAEAYLSSIIENTTLPEDMRLKAAFDLGSINTLNTGGALSPSSQKDVLVQYKDIFLKKPV